MLRTAIIAVLLVATPVLADDRADMVEALGAISISPQICGLALDRAKLEQLQAEVQPAGDAGFIVDIFRVNDRIAAESAAWTDAQRDAFCTRSAALIADLGLANISDPSGA